MTKSVIVTAICFFLVMAAAGSSLAASSSHSAHSMGADTGNKTMETMPGHDMSSHDMEASSHAGMMIYSSMVKGYALTYELIDMKEKMKAMKGMEGMKDMPEMTATHHLMMFVKKHEGAAVTNAMVGYLVRNPDGTLQKAMTMAMSGGYGADVDLSQVGIYTIKVKALVDKNKLVDEFQYEIKAQ
ncbi:hypothetical protein [Desulfocicer niacini]